QGWSAVLIEADPEKFEQLAMMKDGAVALCKRVSNNLDEILESTPIPCDFDLLSIDVDGDDYLIWETLKDYHPQVVVLEVNSSFSPEIYKTPEWGKCGPQGGVS